MSSKTSSIVSLPLASVLEGRKEFYLALAGFYLKPLSQEQIDAMAQTDFRAFGAGETLLEEGFNDIARFLRKKNTGTRQMLATDFTSSFGGAQTFKGNTAMPYASVFLSQTGLLNQEPRAEVFRTYKRNLLRTEDINTMDDHLSIMLEFLAILSNKIVEALQNNQIEDARTMLLESRSFIETQILTWFDAFSELANMLIEERFYRGVLKITKGYLLMDLTTIDDLLKEIG